MQVFQRHIWNISSKAKAIKLKLSGNFERDFDPKKQHCNQIAKRMCIGIYMLIAGMITGINLKISRNFKGDVEGLNQVVERKYQ